MTVNDYLARRDAAWMGHLYGFLGLSVGVICRTWIMKSKIAYAADITYGTNNEFGFDYLRDNMACRLDERFQRELNFAIVDEVDSILIDEARTPLIISGQAEGNTDIYLHITNRLSFPHQRKSGRRNSDKMPGDYGVDEKIHQILLTEAGHEHAERLLAEQGLLPDGRQSV